MKTHLNNSVYLRRRNKIFVAGNSSTKSAPLNYVTTMVRNLESLGYTFTQKLIEACAELSIDELVELYSWLSNDLKKSVGAHRVHNPMYPNFPQQVMEMSESELYINAICYYWTDGVWTPPTEVKERFPLLDNVSLRQIDLGTIEEYNKLFVQLVSANTVWSHDDTVDVASFVIEFGYDISEIIPDIVPQKENAASLACLLMTLYGADGIEYISRFCKTATDILRLAVAMSNGDVSLAEKTKFKNFTRKERVCLLELVERLGNPVEDMLRWKGRWIRLGEKLHVGEYKTRFPVAFESFDVLRNNVKVETFNGVVEKALLDKDIDAVVKKLSLRAGDFARRLDHVLRSGDSNSYVVALSAFEQVSSKISTPVLLQVMTHFKHRAERSELRTFFPKGNVAKAKIIENTLLGLPKSVCNNVVKVCEDALIERFKSLPKLGSCYLDEKLADYNLPFALRSASKSLRTLVRGSKISLPDDCNTIRFFCWWKNGNYRTDIDLSAATFDSHFDYQDIVSFYNLRSKDGCHSGDIVDAPDGASEFIDINLSSAINRGTRYIVMSLNSFSQQPFCDLPECFAGWMARETPSSGEIYEPKTVVDRVDLTADTKIVIPLIIDIVDRKVIWCDLALKSHPNYSNTVHGNMNGMNLTLKSFATMNKPNIYDLLALHIKARGKRVKDPAKAKTVFSVANETQYCLEEIASEYMK